MHWVLGQGTGGVRGAGDHGQDGRRGTEMGHSLLAHQSPDLAGIHRPQADVRTAGRSHGPGETPPVAVEHRQRPEVAAVRTQTRVECHREGLQVRTPVVVHDPLGSTGGTAGVVDRKQGPFVGTGDLRRCGSAQQDLVLALVPAGQHQTYARRPGYLGGLVGQLRSGDHDSGPRVLDDVDDLRHRESDVQGHQNRTAQGDPVVEFEHDVTVRAQRRHPVSRPDAQGGQQPGERPGTHAKLGVGEAHLAVDHGRSVPEDPLRALEEGRWRQLREGEVSHVRSLLFHPNRRVRLLLSRSDRVPAGPRRHASSGGWGAAENRRR